jgi:hypothetical protein
MYRNSLLIVKTIKKAIVKAGAFCYTLAYFPSFPCGKLEGEKDNSKIHF